MSSILKLFLLVLPISILSYQASSQVNFTSSNLPIVVINTNYMTIVDEPKIFANMGIIWNGPGKRNNLSDPMNDYNGKIGIEIRGSSSQSFPKKSYGFETKTSELVTTDVSLLGLPEENDWILYAPYSDKTLIRNVLTFTLDASLGHYSPRCRFVELMLNGTYQGIYVLMEKIKRNKNRVDIAKLTALDNSGEELTGGYILKIDKSTGTGASGWSSDYSNDFGRTFYQIDYPKADVVTYSQKSYIQDYVRNMEKSLYQEKYSGPGSYHDYLNDSSFIDFMIVNELAKNVDGYRISSYLYKGKNELLNCGPTWDYNLAYGNADYYDGWTTNGFQYEAYLGNDYWQNPFWWSKLIKDPAYSGNLKRRWSSIRKKEYSNARITFVIDSLVNLLSEAQVRNFFKWPVLGKYVWPNYYIGSSYNSEVVWMKNWILNRLSFLDRQWPYDFTGTENLSVSNSASVFPNPFTDVLSIHMNSSVNLSAFAEIRNANGSVLRNERIEIQNGLARIEFPERQKLQPGLYLLKITASGQVLLNEKIIKSP
ncbi:MAG: CotH kinase family protein [Prolixibacteraceae bacterium]